MKYSILAATMLFILAIGCSRPTVRYNMKLPPHLFKPSDANELRIQDSEPAVPDGTILGNFTSYNPPPGIVAVIKDGASTNDIDHVVIYYYKNEKLLFFEGKDTSLPLTTKAEHFWEYLRENPLILREGDVLTLKVTNQSGTPQAVQMEMFGYTYSEHRYEAVEAGPASKQ